MQRDRKGVVQNSARDSLNGIKPKLIAEYNTHSEEIRGP